MRTGGCAPTMKDVAREAGVSLGTVSKVFNGINVGENYRKRVVDAANRLGYRVNSYARGLRTNRTNCVALVMPSLYHPFFAVLTDEITACLSRRGYRCILMITNYDVEAERESLIMVRQNKADGVIALTYSPELEVDGTLPVVAIDHRFAPGIPCVSSDNFYGGHLAAKKLLELGCKKLLVLQIGADVSGEPHKRSSGFLDVCRAEGAEYDAVILKESETEAPFFSYLDEHTRSGRSEFDGIFCNSDGLAVRVRAFLEARGIRVPEDVQLIGYDGIINYATGNYDCSTIVQPITQIAECAVNLLLGDRKAAPGENICLPVHYAPGGTTRD